ncbi:MAG: hypothetical protein V1895_04175 [Parcubacteria group bacterium]
MSLYTVFRAAKKSGLFDRQVLMVFAAVIVIISFGFAFVLDAVVIWSNDASKNPFHHDPWDMFSRGFVMMLFGAVGLFFCLLMFARHAITIGWAITLKNPAREAPMPEYYWWSSDPEYLTK